VIAAFLSLAVLLVVLVSAVLVALGRLNRRLDARAAAEQAAATSSFTLPEQAVRDAVRAALAEDRAQELAEARAYWAEQEQREAEENLGLDEHLGLDPYGDVVLDPTFAETLRAALHSADGGEGRPAEPLPGSEGGAPAREAAVEAAVEPAAGPAVHPSQPGFVPAQTPSQEWTDIRLGELAELAIPLAEVRPGPLGSLDVYVFADETTLCVAPGDAAATSRLRAALDAGTPVWLLGDERVSPAHALTFALGEESATVFVLADRVIASV